MVVHNLNLSSIRVNPTEADTPLVIYPYAVLAHPIATEGLQTVAWDRS
jgi:hypothetical protein